MKIIAGLGNPGRKYQGTRHNIGFLVVNELAKALSAKFKNNRKLKASIAKGKIGEEEVILVKPQTFMNLSGSAIAPLINRLGLNSEDLIVIHDDLDLEFLRLKIKMNGGHGGHKGLLSIIDLMGSNKFVRIRMGIGRPSNDQTSTEYVLSPFLRKIETPKIKEFVNQAGKAVEKVILEGLTAAMNMFN